MISTSENQVIYDGTGSKKDFDFAFKILEPTDIHLIRVNKEGEEKEVVSDFFVDIEAGKVYYPGYAPGAEEPSADVPPVLQEGEKLIVYRDVPITQEDDMPEQWPFDVIENALDKSCIIDQQLKGDIDRAIKFSRVVGENFDATFPIVPGKTIRIKNDGTGFETTEDPAVVYNEALALSVNVDNAVIDAQNAANEASTQKNEAMQQAQIATEKAEQVTTDTSYVREQANNIADVLKKTEGVVTPQMFGAVGDGVADDTNALRQALKYSSDNKVALYLPPKKIYLVTDTLNKIDGSYVNLTFNIIGYNSNGNYAPTYGGIKVANNVDLFKGEASFGGKIEKISIAGNRSGGSNVFRDCTLSGIYFSQNYIANFDNFGLGLKINSTSKIVANKFLSVFNFLDRDEENSKASSIIDSTIRDNYINGGKEPTDNVCFGVMDGNGSIITNNFVDYFNTIFCCKTGTNVAWQPPVSIGNQYQVFRYFYRTPNASSTIFQSISDCFNWTDTTASATLDVHSKYKRYTYNGRDGNTYEFPEYIAKPVSTGTITIRDAKIENNTGNLLHLVGDLGQYAYSKFEFTVANNTSDKARGKISIPQGHSSPLYNGGSYSYIDGKYICNIYRTVEAAPTVSGINAQWGKFALGEIVEYDNNLYQAKCWYDAKTASKKYAWVRLNTKGIALSGASTERPSTPLNVGDMFFDTTLGKPIYYKGSNIWVDATGTTV